MPRAALRGTAAQLQEGRPPVSLAWCPQEGPQALLLTCPADDILFGGARGGGKTDATLGDAGSYSQRWAPIPLHVARRMAVPPKPSALARHFRGLLLRRTYDELDEVVARSHEIFGPVGATWQASRYTWRFPWGGFLKLRYLKRDEDASRYQGHSYNWLATDEAGNFPSSAPLDKLGGTLRDKAGVPVREIKTANPGGPGQAWLVDRYIKPARPFELHRDPETGRVRVYIPSKLEDNPLLTVNDPGYMARLKGTGPSWLVAAWLKGDWYATPEGGVIKSKWWRRFPLAEPRPDQLQVLAALAPFGRIVAWVHSWDCAQKEGELNDYSVGTVWAVMEGGEACLVDLWREKVPFPGLRKACIDLVDKWPCDKLLIEDKANGTALIQDLRNSTRLPVHAVEPFGDKVVRAVSSTLLMEAGRMYLPLRAHWLLDFETELTCFPTKGVHDDQVDSVSQFLDWLRTFPLTHVPAVASLGTRVGLAVEAEAAAPAAPRTRTPRPAAARMRRGPKGTDDF